jgi:hypothetical protein
MKKSKKLAKKSKEINRLHNFTGGNYAVGSQTIFGAGVLRFSRLKKAIKIGQVPKKSEYAGETDTMLFLDVRTVDVFLEHLTELKMDMVAQKKEIEKLKSNDEIVLDFQSSVKKEGKKS